MIELDKMLHLFVNLTNSHPLNVTDTVIIEKQ